MIFSNDSKIGWSNQIFNKTENMIMLKISKKTFKMRVINVFYNPNSFTLLSGVSMFAVDACCWSVFFFRQMHAREHAVQVFPPWLAQRQALPGLLLWWHRGSGVRASSATAGRVPRARGRSPPARSRPQLRRQQPRICACDVAEAVPSQDPQLYRFLLSWLGNFLWRWGTSGIEQDP